MAVQTIVSTGATTYRKCRAHLSGAPTIITVDNATQVETLNYTRYGNDPTF